MSLFLHLFEYVVELSEVRMDTDLNFGVSVGLEDLLFEKDPEPLVHGRA